MYLNRILVFVLMLLVIFSCSPVKAPRGSVPKRTKLPVDAFGGWISLNFGTGILQAHGELISVSNDSVYVMVESKIVGYAKPRIQSARLIMYNTDTGGYAAWTAVGSIFTITNGAFMIITLPLTLATGITTTVGESKRINYIDYPAVSWEEVSKYSRFPQGLPEGLNIQELKPKRKK